MPDALSPAPAPPLTSSPTHGAVASSQTRAEPHLRTWRRFAPLGLTAVGLGLSLVGEAAARKERGDGWVLYGTAALCVVNAGLCVFGEAVKHRALADWTLASSTATGEGG